MTPRRYLVMGAGEVGFHLAQSLSSEGHQVDVIELDKAKAKRVRDLLDANMIVGNGAHRSVLVLQRDLVFKFRLQPTPTQFDLHCSLLDSLEKAIIQNIVDHEGAPMICSLVSSY